MWRAYVDACVALADGLGSSARKVVMESMASPEPPVHGERTLGFRSQQTQDPPTHRVNLPEERPFGFRIDAHSQPARPLQEPRGPLRDPGGPRA